MKYDFDLEDHSKKRKEIFLRVLLCALEIGVVLFVAYAITHFGLEKMTVSGKYMSPTLKDGEVYIDGDKLKEKYRFPTMENGGLALEEFTLSEGEYFMLCDNRNECEDSRNANVGNVMSENIVGKAWIRTNHFTLVNRINGFEQKHADPSASPTASAAAN